MSNVTQLHKPKNGEPSFIQCQCAGDYAPLVILEKDKPLIVGLVCTSCEKEIPVTNGFLGE